MNNGEFGVSLEAQSGQILINKNNLTQPFLCSDALSPLPEKPRLKQRASDQRVIWLEEW